MKMSKAKFHGQDTYNDYDLELSWGQLETIRSALERNHSDPVADELLAELEYYMEMVPGPGESDEEVKGREEGGMPVEGGAPGEEGDYPVEMPPGEGAGQPGEAPPAPPGEMPGGEEMPAEGGEIEPEEGEPEGAPEPAPAPAARGARPPAGRMPPPEEELPEPPAE